MKLQITIDHATHAKIMHWVRQAEHNEVSGFGKVLRFANHLHISDATLVQQENTPGSTVLCPNDMGRAMYAMRDTVGDFNFWWHSHHSMSAFMSGTDYDTIHQFGKHGWLLATVFNNRGETATALYVKEPVEFLSEGFELRVLPPVVDAATIKTWDALYQQKVTIAKPAKRYRRDKWHRNEWRSGYREWMELDADERDPIEVAVRNGTLAIGGGGLSDG